MKMCTYIGSGKSNKEGKQQMAYDAKALEIFIASPSDVAAERTAVRDAIAGWNAVYSREQKVILMPRRLGDSLPRAGRPAARNDQ